MITVDTNAAEDTLHEQIVALVGAPGVQRGRLDLGDVMLCATDAQGQPTRRILLERKKWSDWAASVQDGRYQEQKRRALGASDHEVPTTFMYLIENHTTPQWDEKTRGMANKALMAADLNTQIRDGLPVFHTTGNADSAKVVAYLFKKLQEGKLEPKRAEDAVAPVAGVYKRKAQCLGDGAAQYRAMLAGIHGMSAAKTVALVDSYSSFVDLIEAEESELAIIKAGSRKLGPALAHRIYCTLRSLPYDE